ncbi:hypothetical protein [Albidovulum sp.]|jgi:hypothetical protein|uniref:hypothetical protein n=1 Tax=Albidovulum sp. TaxID=1872424 RepID=UPI00304632E3
MIHHKDLSSAPQQRLAVALAPVNLSGVVRDQLRTMTAQGFAEIDIRWNASVLSIEARGEDSSVRRVFNCAGACVMEKVDQRGIAVERCFDADGITLLSEAIFDQDEDR